MKVFSLVVSAVILLGCAGGVTRENFWEKFARATCEGEEKCEPEAFAESFDSVDECTDFTTAFVNAFLPDSCLDACEYSKKDAENCIDATESATCAELAGDLPASCEVAFDCTSDKAIEACEVTFTTTTDTSSTTSESSD